MKCMVLDSEVTDDPNDDHSIAKANGLKYVFTISDVQDIVGNANAQKKNVEQKVLLDAIKYYIDN